MAATFGSRLRTTWNPLKLFPHLTAAQNVLLMARHLGRSEAEQQRRLRELSESNPGEYFVFDHRAQKVVANLGARSVGN